MIFMIFRNKFVNWIKYECYNKYRFNYNGTRKNTSSLSLLPFAYRNRKNVFFFYPNYLNNFYLVKERFLCKMIFMKSKLPVIE